MNTNDVKRITKEYKLRNEKHPEIQTKYGAVDKNNPEVLYIRTKMRITPLVKKDDYSDIISKIKMLLEKNIKQTVENNSNLENKYITTIEISEKSITFGKKSNAKYDVFIKPIDKCCIDEYYTMVEEFISKINNTFLKLLTDNNIRLV